MSTYELNNIQVFLLQKCPPIIKHFTHPKQILPPKDGWIGV